MKKTTLIPARTAAAVAAGFVCSSATFPPQAGPEIATARTTLERWVETRRVISLEQSDWQVGKEVLESRAAVLLREIEALQGRIGDARGSIAEADKKREALLEENARLKEASASLATTVAGLEARTRALLRRLPDPIRERVKPLSQRLPDETAEARSTLSERFQNVVGILNEIDKFHRTITLTSEVRQLGDGTTAEVTAIYLGISQGYFVTASGLSAGTGTSGAEAWVWTPANDAASRIARAIAVLKNEHVAEFVPLPMRIQ
ncbi:MAG: DUF3450 family protein [Planctomycetes bacterium]|nr:DUF3450 family protein [Planctomycetota bacterium]